MIAWQLYIFGILVYFEFYCLLFLDFFSDCKKFKDTVEEIAEQQGKTEEKENEEVSTAAGLVEELTVTEASKEENVEKEEAPASDDKKDAKD